jgi:hypothetical protein
MMSKKHRANIMREVNRLIRSSGIDFDNLSQGDKMDLQNDYIDKACKKRGWTIHDFFFAESSELDSLLGDL